MLLALGSTATYLKPIVGIPLLISCFLVGIILIWQAYKNERKSSQPDVEVSQTVASVIAPESANHLRGQMSIQDFGMVSSINTRMIIQHGHSDWDGVMAECIDGIKWADILTNKCSVCGKPRNESARKKNE